MIYNIILLYINLQIYLFFKLLKNFSPGCLDLSSIIKIKKTTET